MRPFYRTHFYVPVLFGMVAVCGFALSSFAVREGIQSPLLIALSAMLCLTSLWVCGIVVCCCLNIHQPMEEVCEEALGFLKRYPKLFESVSRGLQIELAICRCDQGRLKEVEELCTEIDNTPIHKPFWYPVKGLHLRNVVRLKKALGKEEEAQAAEAKIGFSLIFYRAFTLLFIAVIALFIIFVFDPKMAYPASFGGVLIFGLLALVSFVLAPLSLLAELLLFASVKASPSYRAPVAKTLTVIIVAGAMAMAGFAGFKIFQFGADQEARLLNDSYRAIGEYTERIKVNPKDAKAWAGRARSYNSIGDYQKAAEDYTRVLELDPESTMSYVDRGFAYSNMRKYGKAVDDYTEALEREPTNITAFIGRSHAFFYLGKYQESVDDCSMALAVDPKNADAYAHRAEAYLRLGKKDLADKDRRKANEIRGGTAR